MASEWAGRGSVFSMRENEIHPYGLAFETYLNCNTDKPGSQMQNHARRRLLYGCRNAEDLALPESLGGAGVAAHAI